MVSQSMEVTGELSEDGWKKGLRGEQDMIGKCQFKFSGSQLYLVCFLVLAALLLSDCVGTTHKDTSKLISQEALENERVVILNPRRDDWDSTWLQEIDNPKFREQVMWELDALEEADIIVMYFDPNTKSPISLLELGLFARSKKLIVYCPDGFWRKGNVDIVCRKYGVIQCISLTDFICQIKEQL